MKIARLGALLLVSALSCQKAPTEPLADYNVTVVEYSFSPDSLNVQAGKIVQFNNMGTLTHAIASDSGKWNTMTIAAPGGGGAYGGGSGPTNAQLTISTPGRYPYHCAFHPTLMHGVLIVS